MPPTIKTLHARAVAAPINRPPVSASGPIDKAALVLIDLQTDSGVVGRAYLFAFTPAMLAPLLHCVKAVADIVEGDPLAPLSLDAKLRKRFTLLDPKGLLGLALAGVDMAAWDALATHHAVPLVRLLGGEPVAVPAYNSCGLWIRDPAALADEALELLDDGRYGGVKLRVGRPDFRQDLAAVRAVRSRVPADVPVMCDFNQSLTVNEALRRCRLLDNEGLYWIEEPVRHDDYTGCGRIAAAVDTPLQIGENLLSAIDMQKAIDAEAAAYYMPDVQRIGGVTGWLRAAALAHVHDLDLSSHLFPEISVHLLAVSPTRHWLEYMDWANAILADPLPIDGGVARPPDRPGVGISWNEDAVERFRVA